MKHTDENPSVIEITTQTAPKKNYVAPTGPLSLSLSETEFGPGPVFDTVTLSGPS
jgi:hypothetical protein